MTMYATGELKKLLNSRLATASVVPIHGTALLTSPFYTTEGPGERRAVPGQEGAASPPRSCPVSRPTPGMKRPTRVA